MIDQNLFYNPTSSGMIQQPLRLTAAGKAKAFNVANESRFKSVSESAFLAIEECFNTENAGLGSICISGLTTEIYKGMCEASTPWHLANTGAILYPGEWPSWEADDEAFLSEDRGQYSITHFGEIAYARYQHEAATLLSRIESEIS
jgi:hypothetical protein